MARPNPATGKNKADLTASVAGAAQVEADAESHGKIWMKVDASSGKFEVLKSDFERKRGTLAIAIVGIFAAAIVGGFLIWRVLGETGKVSAIPGKPLPALDVYPIVADGDGRLSIDDGLMSRALAELDQEDHPANPRAAVDLLHLINQNNYEMHLSPTDRRVREKLQSRYVKQLRVNSEETRARTLESFEQIVQGCGHTLSGVPIEFVLHDVRNPLKSIVAVENAITGRFAGGPNTNFGLELIKSYSRTGTPGENHVSYSLTGRDGRPIKSTTIPLYDPTLGLVGFICINIDIEKMHWMAKDEADRTGQGADRLVQMITTTHENPKITEMIEHTKPPTRQADARPTESRATAVDGAADPRPVFAVPDDAR